MDTLLEMNIIQSGCPIQSKPALIGEGSMYCIKSEIENMLGILSIPYALYLLYKIRQEEKVLIGDR